MEDNKDYNKRRKIVSILSFAVLAAFFTVLTILLWKPLTDTFSQPENFRSWVNSHGIDGRLAFVGIMSLQIIFAVIPGEPVEIGAGYTFGSIEGMVLCLVGAAIGSTIVFLFVKQLGIKLVEAFISREKIYSMRFLKESKKLNLLLFIVFFIPGTPKDVITYFIGLTPMKLTTFLIISSIARIPSVITSTITGDALGTQNYMLAVIVFVITAIISLIGAIVYNKISKRKQNKDETVDILPDKPIEENPDKPL
jgi:uncharacterized membrane protein YdjX (TVP38/TMEM64 family)